jgi:hypothetical protein
MHRSSGTRSPLSTLPALAAVGLVLSGCAGGRDVSSPASPRALVPGNGIPSLAAGRAGVGGREVTVDFTSYGEGKAFEPDFYRSDGIVFPPERCSPAGCDTWFVGFVQGDDALTADSRLGPVQATFTRPISDLSLRVAPAVQGTATYVLSVFGGSGELLATTSVTVTQDTGDLGDSGFGYFTISLTNLPGPAKVFTLDAVFVRSSFPHIDQMLYGVSSISYTHGGTQP